MSKHQMSPTPPPNWAAADDGKLLAGGQTLLPTLKQRLANPDS
jgi:CO/xanthine dehydrogenase FAD-binding subunit